jgi:endonuclease-3
MYPDSRCSLDHETPFQLLVATVLSAQCTDARVNEVTPALFRRYPDAAALAAAPQEEVEQEIRSINFYRNKARALRGLAAALEAEHGGEVPARRRRSSPSPASAARPPTSSAASRSGRRTGWWWTRT